MTSCHSSENAGIMTRAGSKDSGKTAFMMNDEAGERRGKHLYHAYRCNLLHVKLADSEQGRYIQKQRYHEDGTAKAEQA